MALAAAPRLLRRQLGLGSWRDLDLSGAAMVSLALVSLTGAVFLATAEPGPGGLGALVVSVLAFGGFALVERRARKPLPLAVFRLQPVLSANLCAFGCTSTFSAMLVLLSLYFQGVLALSQWT